MAGGEALVMVERGAGVDVGGARRMVVMAGWFWT